MEATFANCANLTEIKGIENVTMIGQQAFQNTGFTSFELPAGVKSIAIATFMDCPNLTTFTIKKIETVVTLDDFAFSNCPVLQKITVPNTQFNAYLNHTT